MRRGVWVGNQKWFKIKNWSYSRTPLQRIHQRWNSAHNRKKFKVFSTNHFSFLIFLGGTITSTLALVFFSTFQYPTVKELLPIIINGIFINGVSYIFWFKALKSIPITNSAILVFLTPILSLIWIIIIFNEQFYISYIFGGSIVLISSLYCLKEKSS